MRHRKPSSFVDHPDVEISHDPVPLEIQGKPTVFVAAQESKAPSGVTLAGHDTLGQFLALQRTVTEVERESHPVPSASPSRRRRVALQLLVVLALLGAAAVAVLYAHPG